MLVDTRLGHIHCWSSWSIFNIFHVKYSQFFTQSMIFHYDQKRADVRAAAAFLMMKELIILLDRKLSLPMV